jgi:DNA processing protein
MSHRAVASDLAQKYLRLHLCPEIGSIRFRNLLEGFGTIDAVLSAPQSALMSVEKVGENAARSFVSHRNQVDVEGQLNLAQKHGCRIICLADEEYPAALRMIPDPPPCLFVKGSLLKEDTLSLGIVGSRHCSRYGAEQAERFGALVAGAGMTVVSGLARGVDTYAHRGAIAGGGRTIAVMGCGLGRVDERDADGLPAKIIDHGAVISELPMDIPPDAKNFPPRNRIIAGLSLGVLVIEAARRSGALISARLANEYNREVFAIPGRIDAPYSEGVHDLIKMGGAKLVTCLPDILAELGETGALLMPPPFSTTPDKTSQDQPGLFEAESPQSRILSVLSDEPLTIDAICEASGLQPSQVASTLVSLQLAGRIKRHAGDIFEKIGAR